MTPTPKPTPPKPAPKPAPGSLAPKPSSKEDLERMMVTAHQAIDRAKRVLLLEQQRLDTLIARFNQANRK